MITSAEAVVVGSIQLFMVFSIFDGRWTLVEQSPSSVQVSNEITLRLRWKRCIL